MVRGFEISGRGGTVGSRGFNAGPPTFVIDSFEDGDLSEYSVWNSSGGSVAAATTRAYDGSYALDHTTDGTGGHDIASTSGLQGYPDQGDTLDFRYYSSNSGDTVYYYFGFQDSNNFYKAAHRSDSLGHRLVVNDAGSATELASNGSASFPTGEWVRHKIDWATDGTITCTLYDSTGTQISQISATDTTFADGGVGYGHDNHNSNSTTMQFDFNRVI